MATDNPGALDHLRVLDLTDLSGHYCGRLLADLGADVVLVEPPAGSPTRELRPFAGDIADPDRSLFHLAFNTNKRSVVLDLEDSGGRAQFERLVAAADVVVESFPPGKLESLGLGYGRLREVNPRVVLTSITPFGGTGPYSGYKGPELIAQALGGLLYPWGDPEQRPSMMPQEEAFQLAAQHAAFATLAALLHRRRSGRGQHVEVSAQDVLANILLTLSRYAAVGEIQRRVGATTTFGPTNLYPCQDGLAFLMPGAPRHWTSLVEWMDNPVLKDPVWTTPEFRRQNADVLVSLIEEFTQSFTKDGFTQEAQRRRIPAAPMTNILDLAHDVHLQVRDFFVQAPHPVVGEYKTVGPPYRWSETPWAIRRPAPRLGEHQQEVMEEWTAAPPSVVSRPLRSAGAAAAVSARPLEGVRVLDFGRVWAGPYLTRYLADMGAEVIKVESEITPDRAQVGANPSFSFNFAEINRGKLSITLNTTTPEGVHLFEELVRRSDVVVENFRAGVMDGWGLSYERLREVNPGIIVVPMPGFGTTGPCAPYLSYGQTLLAYTGLMYLWGHVESPERTRPKGAYPDFIAAAHGAYAILAALEYRERTGRGQRIEMAQVETLTATMGEAFLDYFINGRVRQPWGNYNPNAAPHDVYPCRGDDAWCAIACFTEQEWQALVQVVGPDKAWTQDPRFASLEGRLEHRQALNEALGAWTRDFTPRQVMRMLQKAGVPAAIAATAEDLYFDPNLRQHEYLVTLDNGPEFGVFEQPGSTVQFSETPCQPTTGCPGLGEHNQEVFGGLLGLTPEEVQRLKEAKVLY